MVVAAGSTLLFLLLCEHVSSRRSADALAKGAACERGVRRLLNHTEMVFFGLLMLGIGGAVFTFLWLTYARAKKIPFFVWGKPQTVGDDQHPRSSRYPTIPDDMLALPRDSFEIERILSPELDEQGEPVSRHGC